MWLLSVVNVNYSVMRGIGQITLYHSASLHLCLWMTGEFFTQGWRRLRKIHVFRKFKIQFHHNSIYSLHLKFKESRNSFYDDHLEISISNLKFNCGICSMIGKLTLDPWVKILNEFQSETVHCRYCVSCP